MHYDLFISYAHADDHDGFISQFVEKLLQEHLRFTGRQLSIFFDRQALCGMDDWQARILAGLRDSRLFVAFVSPAYQESEYCRKEFAWWSQHEMHRFVLGEGVAPIYIVEVPGLYEAPLRTDQWSERMRGYQCHECRNFHPHGTADLEEQALEHTLHTLAVGVDDRLQRARLAEQSLTYSMPAYNHHFVGRRKELLQLRHALLEKSINAVTAIQGFGGIGKSELALTYAHAYAWDYPLGRFFVPCEHLTSLFTALGKVGEYLEVQFTDEEKTEEARALRVCNELRKRGQVLAAQDAPHHALLILDNVSDAAMLTPRTLSYLPPDVHVIVTTRLEPSRYPHLALQVLECLSLEDGLDLLEMYLPFDPTDPTEEVAGRRIVDLLGGHAFSIEMVGAYLQARRDDDLRYADYLHDLEQQGIRLLDETSSEAGIALFRHDEAQIGKLMAKTYDLLADDEREILAWAVCLPPDAVPLPWLRDFASEKYPALLEDSPLRSRPSRWQQAIARLRGLRLLTPIDENLYRMHRLIRATFCIKDDDTTSRRACIKVHIQKYFGREETTWYRGDTRWELEPIKRIVTEVWEAWKTNTLPGQWTERELYEICSRLGDIVLESGDLPGAKLYYERFMTINEGIVAQFPEQLKKQWDLSTSYDKMGNVELAYGNIRNALQYYQKSYGITESLSTLQPDTLETLWNHSTSLARLGDVTLKLDDLQSSRQYYETELEIALKMVALKPDNDIAKRCLAISYSHLGDVSLKSLDYPAARNFYERDLAISADRAKQHIEDTATQRDLLTINERLGVIAQYQYRLEDARHYYENGLSIAMTLAVKLPENVKIKRDLSICYNLAGKLLLLLGDSTVAHNYLTKGKAIYEDLAKQQPERIQAQKDLISCYISLGQANMAMGLYDEAVTSIDTAGYIARENSNRIQEGFVWSNLGDVFLLQGYFIQAEEAFQAALLIAREVGMSANIAYRNWGLAKAAHYQRQNDKAEERYTEALSMVSTDNDDEEAWFTHFGILRQEMGDTDGAHDLLIRALARCEERIIQSPERYAPYYTRALAYLAIGDTDTAMAAYREALTHCSANGVIHEALLALRLLRRAQPDPAVIAPVEELLRQAMESP